MLFSIELFKAVADYMTAFMIALILLWLIV